MPALTQLLIQPNVVGMRTSLQTQKGDAVFEMIQQFSPEEARIFGRQLIGAADTAESKGKAKEARDKGAGKASKKKAGKRKAAKKARRHTH